MQGVLGDARSIQEAHIGAGHRWLGCAIRVAQPASRSFGARCAESAQGQNRDLPPHAAGVLPLPALKGTINQLYICSPQP